MEDQGINNNNRVQGGNQRQTKGRQKIEMKKISNPDDLLISFSKRRSGIYKKASELVTLCGAEVGVVIFSPSGKPFSYGHPSVHAVLDKFMGDAPPPTLLPGEHPATGPILEAHRRRRVAELSERQEGLSDDLNAERARQKQLQSLTAERLQRNGDEEGKEGEEEEEGPGWWEAPLECLGPQELQDRKQALAELHTAIRSHVKERGGGDNRSGEVANDPPPAAGVFGGAESGTGFPYGHQGFGAYGNNN